MKKKILKNRKNKIQRLSLLQVVTQAQIAKHMKIKNQSTIWKIFKKNNNPILIKNLNKNNKKIKI